MNFARILGRAAARAVLLACALASGSALNACGTENLFEPAVKTDDKEKAQKALAAGNYDEAITSLQARLASDPDDVEARQMLAAAHFGKAGVAPLTIASKVNGGTDWKSIVGVMPAGSGENIAHLEKAVDALEAIPAAQRTPEQNFQLVLAQTSLAVTVAKKVAGDESGKISDAKVDRMSDADANKILDSLNGSKAVVSDSGLAQTNPSAGKLGTLADKIAATPGESDADKLRAYLKKNN